MTTHLESGDFEQQVLQADGPVLVDFYATWCPPCRQLAPRIDELAAEYEGQAKVLKLNVDDTPELAQRFAISAVPTLILFEDGKPVARWAGIQSKQALAAAIDRRLAAAR